MNHELARRLAVAYMSHRLGIGMDYTMKNYLNDGEPGAFWVSLADWVESAMLDNQNAAQPKGENDG